jgi:hypothetical protein
MEVADACPTWEARASATRTTDPARRRAARGLENESAIVIVSTGTKPRVRDGNRVTSRFDRLSPFAYPLRGYLPGAWNQPGSSSSASAIASPNDIA